MESDNDPIIEEASPMPAYGMLESSTGQPQCSGGSGGFCFFCAFESSESQETDTVANDHPTSLRSLVRALLAQKREVHTIIRKIQEAYNTNVRADVIWHNAQGTAVISPEWTLESIKTHLVASAEFPEILEDAIELVFTNIILSQNKNMMNKTSVDPDMVALFLSTVKGLSQYKDSRLRQARQKRGGANKL